MSDALDADALDALLGDFELWARAQQLPPPGDWTTWLLLGGRGAGKTRAGAEFVRGLALGRPPYADAPVSPIALVGETIDQVRDVMIDGVSGLLAVHRGEGDDDTPDWQKTRRRLVWPNGAVAQAFSAEDPDSLRGPQFAACWSDEAAKWRYAEQAWDMLQFALRLGDRPRQMVTTTPRPIPLLKRLIDDRSVVTTRMTTIENAAHLAPGFLDQIVGRYRGTRLGRQELDAELIEDRDDTLFPSALIERARVKAVPPMGGSLRRIVIGVDPPVSSNASSDCCGIVAAGLGEDGVVHVLDDASLKASPVNWARRVASRYHRHGADRVVAEVNQGGDMVEAVLRQVDPGLPIEKVRATRGKWLRAEPVAALYEQGRVRHVGAFPELEDQMADFGRDGLSGGQSPDRLDALVWAVTALVGLGSDPRIRVL